MAWAKPSSYLKAVLTGPTLPFAFQERARYMTAITGYRTSCSRWLSSMFLWYICTQHEFFIREPYVTKNRIRYVISPPRPFASSSSPGNESVKDLEDLNSRCIPLNSCHGEFIYINLFFSYSRMFSMVCCHRPKWTGSPILLHDESRLNVYCPECPPGATMAHPNGQHKMFLPFT